MATPSTLNPSHPAGPAIAARRERIQQAWGLREEIVLIGAGDRILIPGTGDQTYRFRSHPEYFYLTDQECPGGVLAFDPTEGWIDFVPDVTERERVWEAGEQQDGASLALLGAWIGARRARPLAMLGTELPCLRFDAGRSLELRTILTHERRPKDEFELARIRAAAVATASGYAAARPSIRPGATEQDVAIELESGFRRGGGDGPAYDTIVGSGPNSAVLHFSPGRRVIEEGDLVLIDAAAEVGRYCCDVTRVFPGGESFDSEAKDLYDLVSLVETHAIARCLSGAEIVDVHEAATRETTEGLLNLGFLRGAVDDLIGRGATDLFLPHGIAHMVGLGVRDAGGSLPGRAPDARPGRKLQRMNLPLRPGYVITIEPGIYFIPPILNDPARRNEYRDVVRWDRVDPWLRRGGIRIEDTVHVTTGAPEVITSAVPK